MIAAGLAALALAAGAIAAGGTGDSGRRDSDGDRASASAREPWTDWAERWAEWGEEWADWGEQFGEGFAESFSAGFATPEPRRLLLGVGLVEPTAELRIHLGGEASAGVLVSKVFDGTAAEDAGILVGDLIVAVDGEPIRGAASLGRELRDRSGTRVSVDVIRDRRPVAVDVALPDPDVDAPRPRAFAMPPPPLPPDFRRPPAPPMVPLAPVAPLAPPEMMPPPPPLPALPVPAPPAPDVPPVRRLVSTDLVSRMV
jgi:hypothetical protein